MRRPPDFSSARHKDASKICCMKKLIALASLAVLGQQAAVAGTGYYMVVPYPNEGQRIVDFKYWNAKPTGQPPRSSPEIGFGYNVNSRWFTELSASWFQL